MAMIQKRKGKKSVYAGNRPRWIYAVIGVIALLLAGLVYAWSVMSKAISASRPDWTAAQLSVTFTLVMIFFCVGGFLAGLFSKKVNPKIYVRISGILFLAGFFVASLTGDSPALLYFGFGVFGGMAAGLAYNAVMSTMSLWFPDKQGLISGILLMGFGFSSFIIGKIYAATTPSNGSDAWQTTFRIFGIVIVVVMMIISFFFIKPEASWLANGMDGLKKSDARRPALEATIREMIRIPAFWAYYIWAIVVSGAGLVLVSQGSGIAMQVGKTATDQTIATVVGLISIFNGIGRVVFGALYDKKGFRISMLLVKIFFVIASLILIAALLKERFFFIIVGFAIGGFAYGGVMPINSALISDFFGRTNYALNYSIINTNLVIASVASTMAGRLFDTTQSYLSTILLMLILTVAGFVVAIGVQRPQTRENCDL